MRFGPVVAGRLAAALLGATAVAAVYAAPPQAPPQTPVFRSQSTAVVVNVSVRRGNKPVTGLSAEDFVLTDAGVPQKVEGVTFEQVPIDTTVVIDVSGSTSSIVDDIRQDTTRILALLRPVDRARVLVIDTGVYELLPLQSVSTRINLPPQPTIGGMSSVRDAILASLVNHADPGRRRLVVALTDGDDTKSLTEARMLYDVARRTDTVLHLIIVRAPFGAAITTIGPETALAFNRPPQTAEERALLFEAAVATGGAVHGASDDDAIVHKVNVVDAFRKVFEEFRQGYVLQYQPQNVSSTGWHPLSVSVKGVDAKGVRARTGYFASD